MSATFWWLLHHISVKSEGKIMHVCIKPRQVVIPAPEYIPILLVHAVPHSIHVCMIGIYCNSSQSNSAAH